MQLRSRWCFVYQHGRKVLGCEGLTLIGVSFTRTWLGTKHWRITRHAWLYSLWLPSLLRLRALDFWALKAISEDASLGSLVSWLLLRIITGPSGMGYEGERKGKLYLSSPLPPLIRTLSLVITSSSFPPRNHSFAIPVLEEWCPPLVPFLPLVPWVPWVEMTFHCCNFLGTPPAFVFCLFIMCTHCQDSSQ